MKSKTAAFVLAIVVLSFSNGCMLGTLNENIEMAKGSSLLSGEVVSGVKTERPVVVLACDMEKGKVNVVEYAVLLGPGSYDLFVPAGKYRVFAFEDANENMIYDEGEIAGVNRGSAPLEAIPRRPLDNVDIDLASGENGLGDFPPGLAVSGAAPGERMVRTAGAIVDLDDPMFSGENRKKGYWAPVEFFRRTGANVWFVEEYDENKTPILFVHGALGAPSEFETLAGSIDRNKYQPWFYFYPSGVRLDSAAYLLHRKILELREKYGFNRLYLTAHSMGGLVCRSMLVNFGDSHPYIKLFVSISTPWGGEEMAEKGVEQSPAVVPSWRDMVPESGFIQSIYRKKLPENVKFYMFFGYKGDRSIWRPNNDGTVTMMSQLDERAQSEAMRPFGFNEGHVGILSDNRAIEHYAALLEKTDDELGGIDHTESGKIALRLKLDDPSRAEYMKMAELMMKPAEGKGQKELFPIAGKDGSVSELGPILPGDYEMSVFAPAFRAEPVTRKITIREGKESRVEFVVKPLGTVIGVLLPAPGQVGFPEIRKIVLKGAGVMRELFPSDKQYPDVYEAYLSYRDFVQDRYFCLFDIPEGEYDLTIEAAGYETYTEKRTVAKGRFADTRAVFLTPLEKD